MPARRPFSDHGRAGGRAHCGDRGRVTVVTTNAQKVDAVLTAFRSGPFPLSMTVHDLPDLKKKPPPAL